MVMMQKLLLGLSMSLFIALAVVDALRDTELQLLQLQPGLGPGQESLSLLVLFT